MTTVMIVVFFFLLDADITLIVEVEGSSSERSKIKQSDQIRHFWLVTTIMLIILFCCLLSLGLASQKENTNLY
jgi:surface polysaccharide O-acyltransferase-like enzyme